PRSLAARSDPGGDHRADPRGREVRLAPRVQVLDLRDVVDPAGRPARRREQVAHDPDPRAHRRPRAAERSRRADAGAEARPAADRGGGREAGQAAAEAGPRGTAGGGGRHQTRHCGGGGGRGGTRSLDRPVGEGDAALGDLFAAEGSEPEEELTVSLEQDVLRRAVSQLPDREREVLKLRYGLKGGSDPASLDAIGGGVG